MTVRFNELYVGATRQGKTLAAVRRIVETPGEAAIVCDPHELSLVLGVLTHARREMLYERLSHVEHALGFDLLVPSIQSDPMARLLENQRRAEGFVAIVLRRREGDTLAGSPLMEEWSMAAISSYLHQATPKPLTMLPSIFQPGTSEFNALVRDCTLEDLRYKFRQLERLNPRALRAEVGSTVRLLNGVFRSPSFAARSRGGFNLGAFLERRGILLLEAGDVSEDTMRIIMGAVILLVIDYVKRRPSKAVPIRITIDEANNAQLVGRPELKGLAETAKSGLYWRFLVQNLDFPGGADPVLQNCLVHYWYGCPYHDLARKAAVDVLPGLPRTEQSRAERLEELTNDIMTLRPGWRWTRDAGGSRKEYVPMLEHPWPNWGNLRDDKLKETICQIYAHPAYGGPATPASSTSSPDIPPPPPTLPNSSPAERWRRGKRKPDAGSSASENGGASKSSDSFSDATPDAPKPSTDELAN